MCVKRAEAALLCRQALEALLSNVEQPQSTTARRHASGRSGAISQERLEEDQAAACDALAVGCLVEVNWQHNPQP